MRKFMEEGNAVLGIELGSTRIKAVLIDDGYLPIVSGSHAWENKLENGLWTYSLDDAWNGIQKAYQKLAEEVRKKYGCVLKSFKAIGISGMMHGLLALDKDDNLLTPFRTWRNTNAGAAAETLTKLLNFNIPMRWSVAQLYQAILNNEPYIKDITFLTTLSGYMHYRLTGKKVLGLNDASGMFPIDVAAGTYDADMLAKFTALPEIESLPWQLKDILPKVLPAGANAGTITEEGTKLLDPSDNLQAGIRLCPPEGDMGTGMVATNSVKPGTGNISAGTSVNALVVTEKYLTKVYSEIDMITTPDGCPAALVHANNCTSDINAWASVFDEFAKAIGAEIDGDRLMTLLFKKTKKADKDLGGLLSYNYLSGESITNLTEGRPLFVRQPDGNFNLANFMKAHLYSAVATLKIGLDILGNENVNIESMFGHGGFFKTDNNGQSVVAAATGVPITVMENAGEGGAWGIALLAAYAADNRGKDLGQFLETVFVNIKKTVILPEKTEIESFELFMQKYIKGLEIEKQAVKSM